jgi:hypothetical protein
MMSTLFRGLVAGLAIGFAALPAAAQTDYPRRPITLIVPFAAGGPTDVIARIAADNMTRTLGQPIIIENIVGAGGTTASTRAARAAPDGYTIEMGHMGTHAASVALYPNLAYKPDVDFAPIGLVAGTPVLILAKKDFQPKDLKEFVAYVKANEAKLNMAHAGVGSVSFTTCLRARQGTGRRGDAQATARARERAAGQERPRAASARRAGEERDRALDAGDQGCRAAELILAFIARSAHLPTAGMAVDSASRVGFCRMRDRAHAPVS